MMKSIIYIEEKIDKRAHASKGRIEETFSL